MGLCFSHSLSKHQRTILYQSNDEDIKDFSLNGIKTWAKVVDVYDGDTFRVLFFMNQKDKTPVKFKVRANGYNSPEMYPPKTHRSREEEMKKAILSRNRLIQLVTDYPIDLQKEYTKNEIKNMLKHNKKLVYVHFLHFEKFGRVLADVYLSKSGKSINQIMIDQGYAIPYSGEGRDKNNLTL